MHHPTPPPRRAVRIVALLVGPILALTACGGSTTQTTDSNGTPSAQAAGEALTIVATTTILGDVAGEVAGDAAQVTALMPVGSDPHNYEPSAQQLAQMQEADLIVANGGGLEAQVQSALDEAEQAGVPVFRAIDHVDTLTFDEHGAEDAHGDEEHADEEHADEEHADEEHADEEHEHEQGSVDPHFWTDPTRMADAVRALGDEIGTLAGDMDVENGAAAYAQRLADVDTETRAMLDAVREDQRTLVTNHEAFGYFADRYGFEVVGTVIPSVTTGAEPSAQDLEELAATIEDNQVGAIFAENTAPDELAETLAREVGSDVRVVELYSGSLGEEGSGASTYVDMVRVNAQRVSDALSGG